MRAAIILSLLVVAYFTWGAQTRSEKSAWWRLVRRHAIPLCLLVVCWAIALAMAVGTGSLRVL